MADNFFTGATDAQWAVATNWSLGTVPTASDGNVARFDAASPTCSLGANNKVCNGIDFTGYTATLQFGVRTLSVSGNAVLDPGMTWTGTGVFTMAASGSITSNGFQSPATMTFGFTGTAQTYTLQDDLTILGSCSLNGSATSLTINNNGTAKVIYAGQNVSSSAPGCQGTAKIMMNGTGTWNSTGAVQNDFEINTAGTITMGTNVRYATGTFTYTAGTVVTTGSTFNLGLSAMTTTTVNAAGITFNNITFIQGTSAVITLSADLNATGLVSTVSNGTVNGSAINILNNGSFSVGGGASGVLAGTTVLNFTGSTCTWLTGTGSNRLTTNINTAGTLTMTGTTIYGTGTLTHVAGTVVTTGHTLSLTTSCTLDTDPVAWNNISLPASITLTLSSDITVTGTFISTGGTTINGNIIHLSGAMTLGGSQTLLGTTTMNFMAGGSWIGGSGFLRLNTNIIAGVGSFTFVGTVQYNTGTMTYVSGTLVTTGAILQTTTATYNTAGTTFESVIAPGGTITLNSTFAATTITCGASTNVTFTGTSGFNVANFICTTTNRAIILKDGNTYTVTASVLMTGSGSPSTSTNSVTLQSATVSAMAFFNVSDTATSHCRFVRAIDIDSSGGRQMYTVKGLVLRSVNWLRTTPDAWYEFMRMHIHG